MVSSRRRRFLAVSGTTVLAGCSSLPFTSTDPEPLPGESVWSQYGRTARHTSSNPHAGAVEKSVRWQFGPHDYISTPLVIGDSVYVITQGEHEGFFGNESTQYSLYSVAIKNGTVEKVATNNSPNGWGAAQPIIHNGVLYVSGGTDLAAANTRTGEMLWTHKTSSGFDIPPVASVGRVFYSNQSNVYGLNASDGSQLWKREHKNVSPYSPPATDGNRVFISYQANSNGSHGRFEVVQAVTGEKLWSHTEGLDYKMPAVRDGSVYVGDEQRVYAFEAGTSDIEWTADVGGTELCVGPGRVYTISVGDDENALVALNRSDGSEAWRVSTRGQLYHHPTFANGTVYVSARGEFFDPDYGKPTVHAIDAATGTRNWIVKLPGLHAYPPIVADNSVYVTTRKDNDRHVLTAIGMS